MKQIDANSIFNTKEYIAKGKRGLIFRSGKYCIKIKNPDSTKVDAISNEAKYNKRLNEIKVGPKFYYYNDNKDYLIREFVNGISILQWIKLNKDKPFFEKKLKKIFVTILRKCKRMDEVKINKLELTHPLKDILIKKGDIPIIIDFERCKDTLKPKNVSQFCMFLCSSKLKQETNNKIKYSESKMIELSKNYKKCLDIKSFKAILNYVK